MGETVEKRGLNKQVTVGYKLKEIGLNCLLFSDNWFILFKNLRAARNLVKKRAVKTGLKILFEKIEYITNIRNVPKQVKSDYGTKKKFKCFNTWEKLHKSEY